ncbi:MAG: ABC transporter ATP-binding protein [Pseudomonadales bacterium]|nr:ABC transporter ATP-binding protein [Pseudomonadales bacterium]
MNEPMLIAEQLNVERGGRAVLENVSFRVDKGEVFALLGGNGAGKSTTLLTFLGFIQPTLGNARVNGLVVSENLAAIRRQVAYLPESANLYPHLSAIENLDYFLALAGVKTKAEDISLALDRVSLDEGARTRRLESYSKGMRQKVAIALAILRKTPVILLDEPTSGLDPLAIDEFDQTLLSLAQAGTTVLMVTHDVYGACRVAKRVGLLQKGQLVGEFTAPPSGQISVEAVHNAFAGHSGR